MTRCPTPLSARTLDPLDPERPRSACGLLVAARRRRQRAGLRPGTVSSCGDMPRRSHLLPSIAAARAPGGPREQLTLADGARFGALGRSPDVVHDLELSGTRR